MIGSSAADRLKRNVLEQEALPPMPPGSKLIQTANGPMMLVPIMQPPDAGSGPPVQGAAKHFRVQHVPTMFLQSRDISSLHAHLYMAVLLHNTSAFRCNLASLRARSLR